MKKVILVFFISVSAFTTVMSQIIPSSRQGSWTTAGYSTSSRLIPRDFGLEINIKTQIGEDRGGRKDKAVPSTLEMAK